MQKNFDDRIKSDNSWIKSNVIFRRLDEQIFKFYFEKDLINFIWLWVDAKPCSE